MLRRQAGQQKSPGRSDRGSAVCCADLAALPSRNDTRSSMDWSAYSRLTFDYPADGVLLIKINRPERLNAMDETLHTELSRVWLDVDKDDECRVAVVTGEGRAFSAGGDFEMVEA